MDIDLVCSLKPDCHRLLQPRRRVLTARHDRGRPGFLPSYEFGSLGIHHEVSIAEIERRVADALLRLARQAARRKTS